MPNLRLTRKRRISSFRAMAIGTWRTAKDPSVYGTLELDAGPMLAYIAAFRERSGRRLTITHVMAKAVARVLQEMPDANALLRFNRIYLREDIALAFQVALEDPETGDLDLSVVTVQEPERKSLVALIDEFERSTGRIRRGEDGDKDGTRKLFQRLPGFIVAPLLDLLSFLLYTLNLDLRWAGVPRDVFGAATITNVGSLGLKTAYAPLVAFTRVPLVVAVGAVEKRPVVLPDDTIGVGQVLGIHATLDHRLFDGAHAARLARILKRIFADPEGELEPLPAVDAAHAAGARRDADG